MLELHLIAIATAIALQTVIRSTHKTCTYSVRFVSLRIKELFITTRQGWQYYIFVLHSLLQYVFSSDMTS